MSNPNSDVSLLDIFQQQPQTVVVIGTIAAIALAAFFLFRRPFSMKAPQGTTIPPHVTPWFPYLGSAIEMGQDISTFIRTRSQQLNSPIFTATILGECFVFINDPELLYTVFKAKYQKYLDGFDLQKMFVTRVLDLTEEEVSLSFTPEIFKVGKQQYHHYLFKNEELNKSLELVQDFFHQNLPTLVSTDDDSWQKHELYSTVFSTVFQATAGPFLSHSLINDASYEQFRAFDEGVLPLFNKFPNFLTQKARLARVYFRNFLDTPDFWDRASPLMKNRLEKLVPAFVSRKTLSKINLGLVFASVGNSAPAIYWALLHLMQDPTAWKACQDQVDQLLDAKEDDNPNLSLEDLDQLTLLGSAFWETLRLYMANFTARQVTQDFVLEKDNQKYWISKGTRLMPFWGILHSDPRIFFEPHQFQYDRFVDKTKEYFYPDGTTRIPYFPVVAFGGGEHLCPGRKFIAYEAKLYLCLLMRQFDMRLADGESIPGVDKTRQGLGTSHPEREVQVEIRLRKREVDAT